MALISCPECGRSGVSSIANACPGCGAEIKGAICPACYSTYVVKKDRTYMGKFSGYTIRCGKCDAIVEDKSMMYYTGW